MRLHAVVEAGDPEAIDLYLSEDEAQRALQMCLRVEPAWCDKLWVEEIELNGAFVSSN